VKCRPFYLPRELQCVILSTVYIPPAANEQNALKELHNMISRHENSYPDAAMVILGDFNHCDLRKTIPRFYQFVNFPTRGNSTLDKCYSNIKRAYTAVSKPHFGKCDHLAIHTVRTVNMWTDNALMELQGCLEATDMNIFKEATDNIHEYTDTVSSYIDWCTSICIPSRTIRVLPNQKPWFNADVRIKIRNRSTAFKSGDNMEYKQARYELQKSIRAAKRAYTQRLENCYRENNTRRMWQGIQTVTNYRKNANNRTVIQDSFLPDNLNEFYARFDQNNRDIPSKIAHKSEETALQVTHSPVLKALRKVNP